MKTLFPAVIVICVLFLLGIYLFIPARITFSKVLIIPTKITIANRFLIDESRWGKWFPHDSVNTLSPPPGKNVFSYKNYFYSMEKKSIDVAQVSISNNQIFLQSLIRIISLNADSVAIEWKSEMPVASNPFKRISNYIKAKELRNNMGDILEHLQTFLGNSEKVYGIRLHEVMSKDSTLISTESLMRSYPSTSDIYNLIERLRKYIISQKAGETNFPMLHVHQINDTTYETLVAIPVNKYLEGNDKIFNKRFVPWKVLTAEVKGGNYTVNEAMDQMELYRNDYQIKAMAIPFESLVTDRSKQPDTLQWITRIYTPVP
jgi:hypothetical protein